MGTLFLHERLHVATMEVLLVGQEVLQRLHKLSISDGNINLNITHDLVSRIQAFLYETYPQRSPYEAGPFEDSCWPKTLPKGEVFRPLTYPYGLPHIK